MEALYGGAMHRRVTILDLAAAKKRGEKWIMLTAYEQMSAEIFDEAGTPVLLVGDSAGNNFLGFENTIPVTVDELIPLTRAVVRDMVPQDQAASMIGYVTMGMSVVPMIGPVIGGVLDQAFGWQASFVMLGLGGVALFALVWADQGETALHRASSFREQAKQYPELLKSQRFWGYCLAAAFASGAFFAYLGGAPFVGTNVFKLDAATLGFYFGAPALGYLVGNFLSGRFATRYGINRMVMAGALVTTLGLAILMLLTAVGLGSVNVFFGLIITVGLGNGIMLPSANAGLLSVRPALAGSAAGLGGAITIGGGAALSALAGMVLTPGSGTMPLIVLMLVSSAISILCIGWVMRRARAIGIAR